MNGTWQGIAQTIDAGLSGSSPALLAQNTTGFPALDTIKAQLGTQLGSYFGTSLLNLIYGICALIIGFLVAKGVQGLTENLLNRTNIDNRIAAWITGRQGSEAPAVEKWISGAIFWLIMLFAIVAFLQAIQLTAVSGPLNSLLEQITRFVPRLVSAGILLGIAWVLATLSKLLLTRGLRTFRLDERLGQQVNGAPATNQFTLSDTLGNALYWFIFLLFLPSILSTLELQGTLQPVQQLLNQILSVLPNIFGAVLIGATGWFIAQVVRRIVTNLLAATGTDGLGARFGISPARGGQTLSWLLGTAVYVLILIPTAIAALQALKIDAISAPAVSMLTQILNAIPQIFTAALILALAYFLGQFVSDLVTNILTSVGFNNIFYWMGLQSRPYSRNQAVSPPPPANEANLEDFTDPPPRTSSVGEEFGLPRTSSTPEEFGLPRTSSAAEYGLPRTSSTAEEYGLPTAQSTALQSTATPTRTPSELAGIVVLVGIMLIATVAATDVLRIPALSAIVSGIVGVSGRILGGLVVFAIGLYLANLAFNLILSSGTKQSRILAQTARIAIIALVSAMALQQMGIASDIVNLAFGLLFGAIAVAIALAFGLGGRDIAAQQVREWLSSFKDSNPS
ncbi:mechanosensitive ion channel [Microcoleus sp. FACHB-831]|jgi:hypothetical protein|uniref:mechanosensitive ion channel n=1 Tax=Microcoleus sp. FACHB-831 TaxID=2692827 RepID=UPI001685D253|nr:mechanosensitive ion channel [Microcoleus sp. FACHB-831]MBD1920951.1 mechanosensitive ion channel [Microcoleus sp. FACHB-831]